MRIKIITVLCLAALAPVSGFANDGFGALSTGGVTISKTDTIALKNEVLDISCDKIHVSYDFVNESDQDEDEIVGICLPAELKKVSATTYEAHIKNFIPTAELPV